MRVTFANLCDLPPSPSVYIAGIRRSGKTHLAKWMIKSHFAGNKNVHWNEVHVFTGTKGSKQWDDITSFIYDDNLEARLELLLQEMQEIVSEEKGGKEKGVLVVLDDIIGLIPPDSDILKRLSTSARWSNITMLWLVQRYNALFPVNRDNVDALILFDKLGRGSIDAVYDEIAFGLGLDRDTFVALYQKAAKDFRALCIMRHLRGGTPEDVFRWIQAPETF